MSNITYITFNREITNGHGFSYHFVTNEKLTEVQIEGVKEAIQNYLNTQSPIGELASLPKEKVKEIIKNYE